MSKQKKSQPKKQSKLQTKVSEDEAFRKNWEVKCMNCGEKPTVGDTGLCGPCCFGEADTVMGNW